MDNIEQTESKEENIINAHRQALIISGSLSDFQLKNLKTWPFLLLNDLAKLKIKYDFNSNDPEATNAQLSAGTVTFDFKFSKQVDRNSEQIISRLETLTMWTKFLFWKDTEVIFKKGGKKWK